MEKLFCGREMLIKIVFLTTCILFRSNATIEHSDLNENLKPQHQCVAGMTNVLGIHGKYVTEISKEDDHGMTDFSGIYDQYITKLDEDPTTFKENDTKSSDIFNISKVVRMVMRRRSLICIKRSETMSYMHDHILINKLKTDKNVCYVSVISVTILLKVPHIGQTNVKTSSITPLLQITRIPRTRHLPCQLAGNRTKCRHSLIDTTWFPVTSPEISRHDSLLFESHTIYLCIAFIRRANLGLNVTFGTFYNVTLTNSLKLLLNVLSSHTLSLGSFYKVTVTNPLNSSLLSINTLSEERVYNDTQYFRDGEFTEFARCSNVSIQSVILLSTLIPAVVFTTLAMFTYILLRYRRRKLKIKNKKERMYLIRENARDAKYRVFISYNSKDYDFLMEYVYDPLEQNLRQKTGTERNLLCLGDRDFRLGKPVADEIIRCLEESAVFLILLSHNYYHNKYSMMEFEHALRMDKQMIIMVKDEVNENEMTPSLRSYFRNNTRVLWKRRGTQYQLSTTWDNICASILEVTPVLGDPNNV